MDVLATMKDMFRDVLQEALIELAIALNGIDIIIIFKHKNNDKIFFKRNPPKFYFPYTVYHLCNIM